MADTGELLELQKLVVGALRLADRAGLQTVGISLDAARLELAEMLRDAGQGAAVIEVPAPELP